MSTAPDFTAEELATLQRIEAEPAAPESHDAAIWAALTELLPCHPEMDCTDECECTSGEMRLAMERMIVRERIHMADCEGDGCCDRSHALTVAVDSLTIATDALFARAAVAGQPPDGTPVP